MRTSSRGRSLGYAGVVLACTIALNGTRAGAQTRAETLRQVTGNAVNTLDPTMPGSTREAFGISMHTYDRLVTFGRKPQGNGFIFDYDKITQGIKGYTAHEINTLQKQRGRVFWQDECYDHWPRDEDEFFRIIAYIENNPVAAGLCASPADWLWSSARHRTEWNWPVGQAFQPDSADHQNQAFQPDPNGQQT